MMDLRQQYIFPVDVKAQLLKYQLNTGLLNASAFGKQKVVEGGKIIECQAGASFCYPEVHI